MTYNELIERAEKLYNEVMEHKPKDPNWGRSPYYMTDAVKREVRDASAEDLYKMLDDFDSWDDDYGTIIIEELSGRVGLKLDDFSDYNDALSAIEDRMKV